MKLILCVLLAVGMWAGSSQRLNAQTPPVRVETATALQQVTKRIEPVLAPDVVAANPGAVVAADVTVRPDGTVDTVTVVTSPEALEAPTVAALKQWTFSPFVINGRPVRAVVMIDITLANPRQDAERKATGDYFSGRRDCERSVATRSADSEKLCGRLVTLGDALPPDRVLERAGALELHAVSLLLADRPAEALTRAERAIAVRAPKTGDADADLAGTLELVAQAHIGLGNLQAADARYAAAIATLERAIVALPSFRDRYTAQLTAMEGRYAEVKRALRRVGDAAALEARESTRPPSLRNGPLPAIKGIGGTVLMGEVGPQLSDDDLRQLRALVPAGRTAWLIVANDDLLTSERRLQVEVYLDADRAQASLRRGRLIHAEARIAADAPIEIKKAWRPVTLATSYAQVPLDGRDPLNVRGNDDLNRPMVVSQSVTRAMLSDDEIVSLVRFVRSASRTTATADPERGGLYTQVQRWPIASIVKWSDDNVELRLEDGKTRARRGQRVRLKPAASGWTIVGLEPWSI